MGHLLLEHLKGWPRKGVLQKIFFFENALSGSIHSTYQKASLQTDQNPTLGHPSEQRKMETLNKDKGGGGSLNLDSTVHFYFFFKILVPKMKTDVPFQ